MSEDKETYIILNEKKYYIFEINDDGHINDVNIRDYNRIVYYRINWFDFLEKYGEQFDIIYYYIQHINHNGDIRINKSIIYDKYRTDLLEKICILDNHMKLINRAFDMVERKTTVNKNFTVTQLTYYLFNQSTPYSQYLDCFYSFFDLSAENQKLLMTEWEIANL